MATKKAKKEGKKVEILAANLAGKFNLPYAKGEVVEGMDPKQADELIEAGDAKEVK